MSAVVGLADPAQRDASRDRVVDRGVVADPAAREVRLDRARRDHVHPDLPPAEFLGQVPRVSTSIAPLVEA
jgi:hypothetical protein